MNKNFGKTVFVIVLCISVASLAGFTYYLYDYNQNNYKANIVEYRDLKESYNELNDKYNAITTNKKAIIILPGIMGSVLCDDQYDLPLYFDYIDVINILLNIGDKPVDEYIYGLMNCDQNGLPLQSMTPCNMDMEEQYRDGMMQYYKPLRQSLTASYGDIYDVLTWQYDWRLSNTVNGARLEDFINEKGYSKVVLVAHSMGGHVVSNFLQKKINRSKVELFIPIAVPFLGSFGAEDALYKTSYKLKLGISAVDDLNLDFGSQIGNLASVYELLPSYTSEYGVDTHINDGSVLTKDNLYELYASFPKTQKADGNSKSMLTGLSDYQSRMYAEVNNQTVHISRLVNTEYLIFNGIYTSIGASYTNGNRTRIYSGSGDGTVWNLSATAGLPLNSLNVNVLERVGHSDVGNKKVIDTVTKIIGRYSLSLNN